MSGVTGAGATAGLPTSVVLVVLLGLAVLVCLRSKRAQWPQIVLGVAIGVVGADTVIGQVTWSLVDVASQVVSQVSHQLT
jgi:galactitol-specific phosphotransferase system IIC component